MSAYALPVHQHGKSRVRVARVWREGDVHHFVEWSVNSQIESVMEHAFVNGDNTGMTPTDTQKNTVSAVLSSVSYTKEP
jgi:urate oxidase